MMGQTYHNELRTQITAALRSRRDVLTRAGRAFALTGLGLPLTRTVDATPIPATPTSAAPLRIQGISYDVGTVYAPGLNTILVWEPERARRDLAAIRNDLGCTAVTVFGSDLERLVMGAEIALEQGLQVWLQPRLIDAEPDALLDHLVATAREAERLRASGADLTLNVGVELTLFSTGIIPGATFEDRIPTLLDTIDAIPQYNTGLNALLAQATAAVRDVFAGPLTYGSGPWEGVDWSVFDLVSVDLYLDATNRATYVEQLRSYQVHGKPVVITEFGCCCYEGAEDLGPMGYDIIDWTQTPPILRGDYVRSEHVQADYLTGLLDLYQAEGIHGAFVFTFIEPDYPHAPDPKYDLDMASFGIVKVFAEDTERDYATTGYWEPKRAFQVLAERFTAGQ